MNSTRASDSDAAARSSEVADSYRASIYSHVLRLVGDADRADDLTQETFLRVHVHLAELRDPAALESWLYRIATNLCYDSFRHREQRRPALPLLDPNESLSAAPAEDCALRPDQLLEKGEMSECVQRFLMSLPPTQREVLVLHDLQGYTAREIAQRLGVSLENVKIRLHRARARLRPALAESCEFSRDERGVFVCQPKRF